jgi:hypothetical protein
MVVFIVLIIVMILVCYFLVTLWQELGRPTYLEDIIGLTHVNIMIALNVLINLLLIFVSVVML